MIPARLTMNRRPASQALHSDSSDRHLRRLRVRGGQAFLQPGPFNRNWKCAVAVGQTERAGVRFGSVQFALAVRFVVSLATRRLGMAADRRCRCWRCSWFRRGRRRRLILAHNGCGREWRGERGGGGNRPRPCPFAHAVDRPDAILTLRVGLQSGSVLGGVAGIRRGKPSPAVGCAVRGRVQMVAGDGLPVVSRLVPGQFYLVVGERLRPQCGRVRRAGVRLPHHRVGPQAQAAVVARRDAVVVHCTHAQAPVLQGGQGRGYAARVAPAAGCVGRPLHRVSVDCGAAYVIGRVPEYVYGVVAVCLRSEIERRAGVTCLHFGGALGPGVCHARRVHGAHAVGETARLNDSVLVVGDVVVQQFPGAAQEFLDFVAHDGKVVQKTDEFPRDGGRTRLRDWVGGRSGAGDWTGRDRADGPAAGTARRGWWRCCCRRHSHTLLSYASSPRSPPRRSLEWCVPDRRSRCQCRLRSFSYRR